MFQTPYCVWCVCLCVCVCGVCCVCVCGCVRVVSKRYIDVDVQIV